MMLDLLLRNARILTVDGDRPRASSVGIWNGCIVGLDDELAGLRARTVVDAGGATVVPGFHDAHCHTTSLAWPSSSSTSPARTASVPSWMPSPAMRPACRLTAGLSAPATAPGSLSASTRAATSWTGRPAAARSG